MAICWADSPPTAIPMRFALWSNDPPDDAFSSVLAGAFATSVAHVVTFDNSFGDHEATNTVYIAAQADLPIRKAVADNGPAAD